MYEPEAEEALGKWSSSKYAKLDSITDVTVPSIGLDYFYRATELDKDDDSVRVVTPSDVWGPDGLSPDDGYYSLKMETKKAFRYGRAVTKIKFDKDDCNGFSGFESRRNRMAGAAYLSILKTGGSLDHAELVVAGNRKNMTDIAIDSLLPSDWESSYHLYQVKVNENIVEAWIDFELVAVMVCSPQAIRNVTTWEDTEPYSVGVNPSDIPIVQHSFLETSYVQRTPTRGKGGGYPNTQHSHVVAEGEPVPSRTYPLYNENTNTKWDSLATGGAVQTSHPVPIFGFSDKVVYVEADAAGDLAIELYINGDWRQYDSVTLTANELESYTFPTEVQAPLMRCVYTPTDDDTIAYGEVDVS